MIGSVRCARARSAFATRLLVAAALFVLVGCAGVQPGARIEGAASLLASGEDPGGPPVPQADNASVDVRDVSLARWREMIESARRRGALAELAGPIEERARDGPADATAWYALGVLRSAQGRHEEAAGALSRAASIRNGDAEIQHRWGAVLLAANRAADARRPLVRAVELAPAHAGFRVTLASCLARLGERASAIDTLRELARLPLSDLEADRAVRLARALTDPFRGLAAVERAALDPALRDLERDAPGPALSHLDTVLARFPAFAAAHLLAALAAERLGESQRAVDELRKAAALAPELPQPHAYLAQLSARDRPELAAVEYEEAAKRNPLDPAILRRLGEINLDRLGRSSPAADMLARAAQLVPEDAELQVLAARAAFTAGSFSAARERMGIAIRRRLHVPRLLLRLGAAAFDERSRAQGEAMRELMTHCIEDVVRAVKEVDPENAVARGLERALHEG